MAKPIPTDISDDVKARFWAKVEVRGIDECWIWRGTVNKLGYGRFHVPGHRAFQAHRLSLAWDKGVRNEQVTDHLCRNPSCVNPAHLEAVSNAENTRRGLAGMHKKREAAAITHCPKGHEYSPENTRICARGARTCITCQKQRLLDHRRRMHAKGLTQTGTPRKRRDRRAAAPDIASAIRCEFTDRSVEGGGR